MPKVEDGTYVVTWRVISADAHPVQGAFTFQVGAKGSVKNADALAKRLLANQGGSTTVGAVYAVDRVAIFATLALLVGGIVFLSVVFPAGRDSRRAQRIVWGGWIGAAVATVAGIALDGIYAAALPLTKIFDPSVFGEVLDTRYGRVSLARLGLLALAYPLLRVLLTRHPASEHRLPKWWLASAGLLSVGLSLTPGLAGHAGSGEYTGLAIPADAIHVLAMACWLGGLVLLFAVVLCAPIPPSCGGSALLRSPGSIVRWSSRAASGVAPSRQLQRPARHRLREAADREVSSRRRAIVAAAFSREVVNRRFRLPRRTTTRTTGNTSTKTRRLVVASVSAAVGAAVTRRRCRGPARSIATGNGSSGTNGHVDDDDDWQGDDDETEVRRLKRSVFAELIIAFVVLAITALLVNAAPARSIQTQPISMTLKSSQVWVDVVIAPGVAGGNDIHLTALPVGDTVTNVEDMAVQLTRPGADLPPFSVPLTSSGPATTSRRCTTSRTPATGG
jgi:copper transport protein